MTIFLSEQLKKLRKEKGNTQEELAMHLGITTQAVSKWERDEGCPDITLLPAIASYYDVSIDDLLGVGKIYKEKKLRRDLSRYVFAKECAIRIDKQQKECYNNAVINNGIII